MGDLFKGVHLLPQGDFETAVETNQIDDDVLYVTPEDFSELAREQVRQIEQNTSDIARNKTDIDNNSAEISIIKTNQSNIAADVVDVKNSISEIIVKNIAQDTEISNKVDKVELSDYVKTTDYATSSKAGIGIVDASLGLTCGYISRGKFNIMKATDAEIEAKQSAFKPIVPNSLDKAIAVGLTTNTIELTDEEKAQAQSWLGIDASGVSPDLTNVVTLDGTQTITGLKTFTEHIYLANSDGTIDRISHLNNNFIIHSGATNSAVLNIDEGLEKIYAFNEELAFKSDITQVAGSTVYVNGEAVSSVSFNADPQTQINLLSESIDAKLSKAGDTMSGELKVSDGIAFGNNKVRASNAGNTFEIVHVENDADKNIFNYTHGATFTLNNSETPLIMQGYGDRPSYVSGSGIMSAVALETDIAEVESDLYDVATGNDTFIDRNFENIDAFLNWVKNDAPAGAYTKNVNANGMFFAMVIQKTSSQYASVLQISYVTDYIVLRMLYAGEWTEKRIGE